MEAGGRVRAEAIGRETFRATALQWLELGPRPGSNLQVPAKESDYQRGLLWSLVEFPDAETCAAVARFAEQCLKKIPMISAVSQKSGNACIKVLASMDGMEPVSQLARLALRVKYSTAQRLVAEALEEAAGRQGVSREQLAEITVPDFGLNAQGLTIERKIIDLASPSAAPQNLKRDFAGDLKDLEAGVQRDWRHARGSPHANRAPLALATRNSSIHLALGLP